MFSKTAIARPVTTVMAVLVVFIVGIVAFTGLKMDLMPSVSIPVAIVSTTYSGAGPKEIESLITKPIEESMSTVANVDEITSVSSDGASIVVVVFENGTDLDFASLNMREKIDMIKGYLPEDATDPMVLKIDMSMMSNIAVGVYSDDMEILELSELLDEKITNRFEKIEGVASASLTGNKEKEIEIVIDQDKAKGYGLNEQSLAGVLRAENVNYPSGTLTQGQYKLQLRAIGEFKSIDDIRELPLLTSTGAYIKVKDVANVREVEKEISNYSMINGKEAVLITMQKQSDANIVEISRKIMKEMDSLSAEYPSLHFTMLSDTSSYIEDSMNSVLSTVIIATILAVIVLLVFLKDYRASFIIGVSIPTSVIATFIMMYVLDMTMNIVSMGGLTIGIGMFVDNSIVVLENIYRHSELGKDAKTASFEGVKEVSMSITASTLTTVAVFIPLMFISGTVGEIFKDLSLTVVFSLMASLVVALTFVPMACALVLGKEKKKVRIKEGGFLDKWDKGLDKIDKFYKDKLAWCLDHQKKTALVTLLIFIVTLALVPVMGVEFMPSMDQGSASITVNLPKGSVLEETGEITEEVLSRIETIPEIETVYVIVGGNVMSSLTGSDTSSSSINIIMKPLKERSRSTDDIVSEIKDKVKDIAGAEITAVSNDSAMGSYGDSGVALEITGDDIDELRRIGDEIAVMLNQVEGVKNAESSAEDLVPEANILINREKAGSLGITAASLSSTIRTAVTGSIATQYKVDGTEIDVVIRQDKDKIEFLSDLKNVTVSTATGAVIPITEVADITIKDSTATIERDNQHRFITVEADIEGRDSNSVKKDITALLNEYEMPEDYSYRFTGMMEMMSESYQSLAIILLVAILLVYMIMASQFESVVMPLIVLFSVPLALTGGVLGLFICGQPISITSFMGFIMLVGMVVNNAIVLIDYTSQVRKEEGLSAKEALLEAGPTRLRPILMTTLTTVIGLVPMALALGEGSEMQQPMSIVVIFGLMVSMLVTLVFIPIVYLYVDKKKQKILDKKAKKNSLAEDIVAE